MLLGSTIVGAAAIWFAFEAYEGAQYARWRAGFDNRGALSHLTVASDDPKLLWEYRPYGHYDNIVTNRYGFRDLDRELTTKKPGVYRVVFVGDSVTLGLGVDFRDTFVRGFERAVRRDDPGIEALNLGVDGYNTRQIHELVRTRALRFSPDAVVYVMSLNDFDYQDASGNKILYFKRPRSFLLARLRRLARALSGEEYHLYHFRRNRDDVLREVKAMADSLEHRGITFVTVLVPVFDASRNDFDDYPLEAVHREIGERLNAEGVAFIDLLPDFRARHQPPRRFANDIWHPNEKGHELIARVLAAQLADVDAEAGALAAAREP